MPILCLWAEKGSINLKDCLRNLKKLVYKLEQKGV